MWTLYRILSHHLDYIVPRNSNCLRRTACCILAILHAGSAMVNSDHDLGGDTKAPYQECLVVWEKHFLVKRIRINRNYFDKELSVQKACFLWSFFWICLQTLYDSILLLFCFWLSSSAISIINEMFIQEI